MLQNTNLKFSKLSDACEFHYKILMHKADLSALVVKINCYFSTG
jgi:hypothetical protein